MKRYKSPKGFLRAVIRSVERRTGLHRGEFVSLDGQLTCALGSLIEDNSPAFARLVKDLQAASPMSSERFETAQRLDRLGWSVIDALRPTGWSGAVVVQQVNDQVRIGATTHPTPEMRRHHVITELHKVVEDL